MDVQSLLSPFNNSHCPEEVYHHHYKIALNVVTNAVAAKMHSFVMHEVNTKIFGWVPNDENTCIAYIIAKLRTVGGLTVKYVGNNRIIVSWVNGDGGGGNGGVVNNATKSVPRNPVAATYGICNSKASIEAYKKIKKKVTFNIQ